MANLFQSCFNNHLVSGLTAIIFTTTILTTPLMATEAIVLDIKTINLGIKVEKIFEKIKKCINRGETNKIVSYMFEIKDEVESYTGKKIDIGKYIDQFQKEAKQKGQKINDTYLKQIKKDFIRNDKKNKHKAIYFAQCVEAGIPFTSIEAEWNFENIYMAKNSDEKNDKDIEVPITVTVGVTLGLCGLFLVFLPEATCVACGWYLLDTGIGILGAQALTKWEEYNREQKMKK